MGRRRASERVRANFCIKAARAQFFFKFNSPGILLVTINMIQKAILPI